jgi:hypothetical protein
MKIFVVRPAQSPSLEVSFRLAKTALFVYNMDRFARSRLDN